MRLAGTKLFSLIVCSALAVSMADARMTKGSVRAAAKSASVRNVAAGSRTPSKRTRNTAANWRQRGQQAMKPNRVRQIQIALIRESYLKGRANGVWDERSRTAMARFQSENGWQSRVVPDSRALIRLGLGPDYAGLINPDTAVINRN